MATQFFNSFKNDLMSGAINLIGDTIKVMLVTASYVPDIDTDTKRSHVTNESSGTGYVSGGAALDNKTLTQDDVNDRTVFEADNVEWVSSSINARGAVLYKSTGAAASDPLIAYIDFGETKISTDGQFLITWDANGILVLG